ncbi:MAG: hypothetical protein JNL70_07725 [Saprospiraceae bacterium]|nr:hypothetical protein [Saprospiraceae bacterium]
MSDFWSKFKGVFIQPDPNAVNRPTQPEPKANPNVSKETVVAEVPPSVQQPTFATSVSDGSVSEKFMQALFGAMEGANLDGFDYFEFKLSLKNLANMPMDEATRYKSAFAMASTMGATSEKLVNSAMHYLDVLKNENTKFSQAAENQRVAQVGNKQSQVDNLEAVMQQKAEQIKRLTEEIEQHRKEVMTLKDDIIQSTVKVEQTQKDFMATYQNLVGQIEQDVANMKNYLK